MSKNENVLKITKNSYLLALFSKAKLKCTLTLWTLGDRRPTLPMYDASRIIPKSQGYFILYYSHQFPKFTSVLS